MVSGVAGLGVKAKPSDIIVWGMSLLFLLVGVTFLVLYARRSAKLDVQTRSNEGNAQVHQLGALRQEYSVRLYKLLALYLYGMLALLVTSPLATFVDLIAGGIMLVLLPFGGAFFYYRQLHVYVYTDGFLYLDGNHSRAVRWEQISKVSRGSWLGAYVKVQGESTITLPAYISGLRNLRSTIEREMASRRTSSAMGG